jgi:hypothetical protein
MPNLAFADGWKAAGKIDPKAPAKPALYDLTKDPGETQNLYATETATAKRLAGQLTKAKATPSTRPQ